LLKNDRKQFHLVKVAKHIFWKINYQNEIFKNMRWRRKFEKAEFQALLSFDFCHTQGNRSKTYLGLAQQTI